MKNIRAVVALFGISVALLLAVPGKSQIILYDVVYGQNKDWKGNLVELSMDIGFPRKMIAGKKYPLVMEIHAGSFYEGRKENLVEKCLILADSGFIVATIDYRLGWDYAPQCKSDTATLSRAAYRAVQDANAALRFLVYKASVYNIDTGWIFVGGISAGAITALEISYLTDQTAVKAAPEIVAELGGLKNAGNSLTNTYTIKGISSIAGALTDSSMIFPGNTFPTIFFQGDSDEVIPVDTGTHMWCPNYSKMFGSLCLYRRLTANNELAFAHILHGGKHENSDASGYGDEFTMSNTACFFHKIMAKEKLSNKIYYNYEYSCDEKKSTTFYRDNDADGYGNIGEYVQGNTPPSGYVTDGSDCNDSNATVYPGAAEICDGLDNNCNGVVDENTIKARIAGADTIVLCSGEKDTLHANKLPNTTYQWGKDGSAINGANTASLVISTAGNYAVAETLKRLCRDTSAITVVLAAPKPKAEISTFGSQNICNTESDTLVATRGTGFKYQWLRNNINIPGAKARAYIARSAGDYRVTITNKYGCATTSAITTITSDCFPSFGNQLSIETATWKPTFSVYPNPASDKVGIHFTAAKTGNIEILIFNMTGRQVYARKETALKGSNDYALQVTVLSQGIYYIELKNETGNMRTKLIIEK